MARDLQREVTRKHSWREEPGIPDWVTFTDDRGNYLHHSC